MSFKEWLETSEYKDKDPLSVTILHCNNKDLTSLKGVENLKNLTGLDCHSNKLKSLKGIEYLTNLKILNCHGNNLEHEDYDNFRSVKEYQLKEYQQYLKRFYRKDKIRNLIKIGK